DGIRDRNVTGVQTCALPIWTARHGPAPHAAAGRGYVRFRVGRVASGNVGWASTAGAAPRMAWRDDRRGPLPGRHPAGADHWRTRSEERRVGKACSYRWAQDE